MLEVRDKAAQPQGTICWTARVFFDDLKGLPVTEPKLAADHDDVLHMVRVPLAFKFASKPRALARTLKSVVKRWGIAPHKGPQQQLKIQMLPIEF